MNRLVVPCPCNLTLEEGNIVLLPFKMLILAYIAHFSFLTFNMIFAGEEEIWYHYKTDQI